MKIIEDIAAQYKDLVESFLPHRISEAGDIGFQIEILKLEAENNNEIYYNFRLKEESDEDSNFKYSEHKNKSDGESVDDIYIPTNGAHVYCGFSVRKIE